MDRSQVRHKDRIVSTRVTSATYEKALARAAREGRKLPEVIRSWLRLLASGAVEVPDDPEPGRAQQRRVRRVRPGARVVKLPIPPALRWEVWERDNFTCLACGTRKHLAVDHITPESKGGPMGLGNLQTLCRSCNSQKGNRT